MHQIKISKAALEAARKQFCLDTCLDWQEYLENPDKKCYIQKTVYAPSEQKDGRQPSAGRYSAFQGARKYDGNDAFLKAILCMGQLFLAVDEQIYDWAVEKFADCEPEWFCEYGNLRMIDKKLKEYGRRIADTHIYFLPEEGCRQQKRASDFEATDMSENNGSRKVQDGRCDGAQRLYAWYEYEQLPAFRENNPFKRALGFSPTQPDRIAVAALKKTGNPLKPENIAGMAGVSEDGAYLWQIGIDVIREYEGRGLATDLVTKLKEEVLRRGKIPFYGTSESHTVSQTVALKAGFVPAWTEIYVKQG